MIVTCTFISYGLNQPLATHGMEALVMAYGIHDWKELQITMKSSL